MTISLANGDGCTGENWFYAVGIHDTHLGIPLVKFLG
jgi:hypothetical protein